MATLLSPEVEQLRVLGRPTDSLPHLPSRPTNMVGLQRPPAVVSWALPPAFGCTACRLRRAGTRNRHAPKCAAPNKFGSFGQFRVPAPLRGWEGARALPPRSFLADLDCSSPVFRPKTTRLPHQFATGRLGLLPKPVLRFGEFFVRKLTQNSPHLPHCNSSSRT